MTPNTRHGFSTMYAGRGVGVKRVLHHRDSLAVAPRLDDVDASQLTPARAYTRGPLAWASDHRPFVATVKIGP